MNLEWFDWVGLVGTLMVLGAFFLLQAGRLNGNGIPYQLLNLFGASGVLVCGASANPFSWKSLRGSMGSALRLPVALLRRSRRRGRRIVGSAVIDR